jgi:hypothetical protein
MGLGYKGKNIKKVAQHLEINEEPVYTQMKNNGMNFILNENFILGFLNEKVKEGELSKITKDNLPYFYSYRKRDLERKIKIQNLTNSFGIKMIDYPTFNSNGIDYRSNLYETGVVKKCKVNNEPKVLDSDLNKIFKYCKANGITHVYEIIEKRSGVDVNKVNLSLNNIVNINLFSDYNIKYDEVTHLAYRRDDELEGTEECSPESEGDYGADSYYDIDVNKLKHSENSIRDCYIFNEVSYTIRGIKTFPKEVVDDFTMCKVDFEYFYNKYVKKNNDEK